MTCCICGCEAVRVTVLTPLGGGITSVGGTFFTSVRAGHNVTITATTAPNNDAAEWAQIQWQDSLGNVQAGGQTFDVVRAAAGEVRVTATLLGRSKRITLHFVDLVSLVADGAFTAPNVYKSWVTPGGHAKVLATTNPDWRTYRNKYPWAWADAGGVSIVGDPDSARRRRVPIDVAGNVFDLTATVYEASLTVRIRTCQPPVLALDQLTFDGHVVNCDTSGNFDRIWAPAPTRTEPDAAARTAVGGIQNPTGAVNSILCFTRGTAITITADFTVNPAPTDNEVVTVRGRATIGGQRIVWEQVGLAVNAGVANVTSAPMVGNAMIPNRVARYENVVITWEMVGPDDVTRPLGTSRHRIYAILNNPAAPLAPVAGGAAPPIPPVYWTAIHFSCVAASGAQTAAALVTGVCNALRASVGTGNGLRRSRDDKRLAYWIRGYDSAGIFNSAAMLGAANGGGRCGAWARFFADTLAIHGVQAAHMRVDTLNAGESFLVKNATFTGAGAGVPPWTHVGQLAAAANCCSKPAGVAGQGNDTPQSMFQDHAIVLYNGAIYDPSYGLGPFAAAGGLTAVQRWEAAALDGLASGVVMFINQGGAPDTGGNGGIVRLSWKPNCSRGYIEYTILAGDNLLTIVGAKAVQYGMTTNALWTHPYNAAVNVLRGAHNAVQVGDVLLIPRAGSNIRLTR